MDCVNRLLTGTVLKTGGVLIGTVLTRSALSGTELVMMHCAKRNYGNTV